MEKPGGERKMLSQVMFSPEDYLQSDLHVWTTNTLQGSIAAFYTTV